MLIEKFVVIGIKYPKSVIVDISKDFSYSNSNVVFDPIRILKEYNNNLYVDTISFYTKQETFERLTLIKDNIFDVQYWSILPIIVDVSLEESRSIKIKEIKKKLKKKF